MIKRLPLLFVILAVNLHAQQESPTPTPEPSPTPEASPTAAPSPLPAKPISSGQLLEGLTNEQVVEALGAIKGEFLDAGRVTPQALERATLVGLLRQLSPGVMVVNRAAGEPGETETSFLAEILDSHIGYLRLGALNSAVLPQIDATLSSFPKDTVDAVVLDLRGISGSGNFEVAADVARRFCPNGRLLFTIKKPSAKQERIFTSNQEPVFQGVLVVLIDAEAGGAAEALAATLRQNAGAMVIGAKTVGGAAEYANVPLSDQAELRVAVAQVIVPEVGPMFPNGVTPDISIALPLAVQKQIFTESKEKGMSQFVYETERKHLNEAALAANLNPEIDAAQAAQRDRGKATTPRDIVLQRAVDLITAINFYKSKRP